MDSWYKITLSRAEVTAGVKQQIMDKFLQLYLTAGGPSAMALLNTLLDDDIRTRQSTLYFTPACFPACLSLVTTYSGMPCDEPTEPVELLIGDANVWG
jgi:hypothetical protein